MLAAMLSEKTSGADVWNFLVTEKSNVGYDFLIARGDLNVIEVLNLKDQEGSG